MNKKLLALAVAGAFAAPVAAMADTGNVTVYGQANASYDIVDTKDGVTTRNGTTAVKGERANRINDNASRLGFKGTEDLGNGLSAVFQMEASINLDDGTGGTFNRNSFVGLSGKSWGTALLGRHDTPYKISTRRLDQFAETIGDNRSIMGGGLGASAAAAFDGRQSNVVAYISPSFSGFSAAAAYVAGAETPANGDKKGNAWSLAGMYDNGPLYATLAYERHNFGTAGSGTMGPAGTLLGDKSEKAWKVGAGYNFGAFDVSAAYEKTSDDFGNNVLTCGTGSTSSDCAGHKAWFLGGKYTFGSNAVKLQYATAGDLGNVSTSGAKQWSVGLDHNFSKRTRVYAMYTKMDNDNGVAYSLTNGGNGTAGNVTPSGFGADPTAWSFGVKHSF